MTNTRFLSPIQSGLWRASRGLAEFHVDDRLALDRETMRHAADRNGMKRIDLRNHAQAVMGFGDLRNASALRASEGPVDNSIGSLTNPNRCPNDAR